MANHYLLTLSLMILLCIFISPEATISTRKLESISKISLKSDEIGFQYIINESFQPLPDKILINGQEVNQTVPKIVINKEGSIIELIWNNPLSNCHAMFKGMSHISEINFTDFDTSKVTDMSKMFMNCESLENLDLSSFDTSNVEDMSYMFSKCDSLKNIEISNFKTSKVKNMARMFEFCDELEYINIDNFDTSSVINMDYMFRFCLNMKQINISKFNTKNVKSIKGMFAGCYSLIELNLKNVNFSNVFDSSYMIFDTNIMRLDLSGFSGFSIKLLNDMLKYNPKLNYINLLNYKGQDIFNNLDLDKKITICTNNETIEDNSNFLSLSKIKENITNNCSDMCFYEFSKIKEDKKGCEVDCSKIEDENNIYYYLCVNNGENIMMNSTITESTMISETNSESISSSNNESIFSSNIESISTTNHESISSTKIESSDNTESKIATPTLNEERTKSVSTDIEVTTPQTQANIANQTSFPSSRIKQTSIPTVNKTTIIYNLTNNTEIPKRDTTISDINKSFKILLYGYDSYSYRNKMITFSIYFMIINGNDFPKKITFTINIIFDYILRILSEKSKKTATCILKEENKLVKYNCEINQTENIDIKNIEVNYDFDFDKPYELKVSSIAEFNKDKIINQTTTNIFSGNLILFYGDLSLENDYFRVKGKLDENSQINNNFKLNVYSEDYKQISISCEVINNIYNNFEIKCDRDKSVSFSVNNTISYMEQKQLLIIINDGGNDFVDKVDKISLDEMDENGFKDENLFNKKNNRTLSGGIIALIIVVPVIAITIILLIIFRTKLFKNKTQSNDSTSTMESKNIFELTGENLPKV